MLSSILLLSFLMASIFNPVHSVSNVGMSQRDSVITIDFPLRGIWITPHSPGTKVPSHGTANFGESYAIDFVMIQDNDPLKKPYRKSIIRYVLQGLPLSDFYGWGQTIYSPIDGEVVSVVDSIEERNPVRIYNDIINMMKVTQNFMKYDSKPDAVAGNYVLLKCSDTLYALLAHMKKGSIVVKPGQKVRTYQPLGQLGHSGNSTMPHLHMQFMDSKDFKIAEGIPFVFRNYEVKRNGRWEQVYDSVPTVSDVIRYE